MASPRCQSRESSGSGGRCPSDDSNHSGSGHGESNTPAPPPIPTSPVGLPLPATLPPAAAAALLPPQSAAMAAYLNVAAVAAQQNRLLLAAGNPALAASLAAQAQQTVVDDSSVLDFSTKRIRRDSDADSKSENEGLNLSNKSDCDADVDGEGEGGEFSSPLDLSVPSRKRIPDEDIAITPTKKVPRPNEYKPVTPAWPPINPYLAAVAAASLSPKNVLAGDWNGKNKLTTNDATKALEKMSEMTRLGDDNERHTQRPQTNHHTSNSASSGAISGRHSAWQSHWLNKGADAAKHVFKCVWCKQSFPSLDTLTTHMKETQHCGVQSANQANASTNQSSHHHSHHHSNSSSNSSSSSSNKSDLNMLIKETMPLPRKLVRGQDVWLGKGAEQTRQILKCMWCGQSFRSLAEMTSHMQQTQHYTNIISQEQIISWKSAEERSGSSSGGGSGNTSGNNNNTSNSSGNNSNTNNATSSTGSSNNNGGSNNGSGVSGNSSASSAAVAAAAAAAAAANNNSSANSTVSAVLTCKVCDQAFTSLKDLSNHMVKNAHYKEHIMRSITESGGRRRQTREKRKKSLPVRKLLELERAQHDFKNGVGDIKSLRNSDIAAIAGSTKITCEKCGDKIETALFVEHIRQCVGAAILNSPRSNLMKTPISAMNNIIPPDSPLTPTSRDGRKSIGGGDGSISPVSSQRHISPHAGDMLSPTSKENSGGDSEKTSSPSVLNAIEQLIEKSFDTRSRHGNNNFPNAANPNNVPLGSSILKRLGIDESVDYTKPLMDPQTMNLLRSYQQHQQNNYPKRERSGSESSSVSDRGSSRLESLTPERKPEIHRSPSGESADAKNISVKSEPADDSDVEKSASEVEKISIKTEPDEKQDEHDRKSATPSSSAAVSPPSASPAGSDRSTTPRSERGGDRKLNTVGSLSALSSMFDNLNGNNQPSATSAAEGGETKSGKKGNFHPLAALQKLCDKTEKTSGSRSGSATALAANLPPTSAAAAAAAAATANASMVAFSWACNEAIMNADSVIKCKFCDTPFVSKGAYRHHLSKVHFVKDDANLDQLAGLASKPMRSPSASSTEGAGEREKSSPQPPSNSQSPFDESPHSKFLKYTELAKQLSSKYV